MTIREALPVGDARRLLMTTTTFEARVVNGQLQYRAPLDAFEGRQVRVTLDVLGEPSPQEAPSDEPPEWLDVEKDVYIKMPRQVEILKDVKIVEKGPRQPRLILPEELPDE
jgi:hypothetical protein